MSYGHVKAQNRQIHKLIFSPIIIVKCDWWKSNSKRCSLIGCSSETAISSGKIFHKIWKSCRNLFQISHKSLIEFGHWCWVFLFVPEVFEIRGLGRPVKPKRVRHFLIRPTLGHNNGETEKHLHEKGVRRTLLRKVPFWKRGLLAAFFFIKLLWTVEGSTWHADEAARCWSGLLLVSLRNLSSEFEYFWSLQFECLTLHSLLFASFLFVFW